MKVELSKLRLATKALTDTVSIGIPAKDNKSFVHDIDVTSDFIRALIDWCGDGERIVVGAGEKYKITICKITEP